MNLTIKSLKTWYTPDGGGYHFNLYKDGKKIAFVFNEGNGGMVSITWDSCKEEVMEYVKSLPEITVGEYKIGMTIDILMENLVNDHQWDKKLARYRKSGILFRLLSDPENSFRTIKTLDLNVAKDFLDKKHPNSYILI